jgi:flagellar hook-basal body complex protein FliE
MDTIRIGNGPASPSTGTKTQHASAGIFSDALRDAVNDVEKLQKEADKAIVDVQTGHTGSIHEAIIALEKADISFRTMLQVRNKLIEAYQEIMRMQV